MAFKKDFEDSKKAVGAIRNFYERLGCTVRELNRDEQINGDLEIVEVNGIISNHEVKFDIMGGKTGNLCFETHNGKGDATGILSTKASHIDYVVPQLDRITIYQFKADVLKNYLFNGKSHRVVQGGDKKKYTMILIPIQQIIDDLVADLIFDAQL